MAKQVLLRDLNKHLVCSICDGYYRDAYTICECLHTFCRQCLYDAFSSNAKPGKFCPECKVSLGTKPKIVYDRNLQSCIDKLFPEFLKREEQEREQDTENERKRTLAALEVDQEQASKNRRIEADSNSGGNTKTFPDVIVTLKISPSEEKLITAANTPVMTLLVPLNSTTAELRKFIMRKYKKEKHRMFEERFLDKLNYYCGNTLLEMDTPLTKVAFANGYEGEEDSSNRATVKGHWMTLAVEGKWDSDLGVTVL